MMKKKEKDNMYVTETKELEKIRKRIEKQKTELTKQEAILEKCVTKSEAEDYIKEILEEK